MFLKPYPTFSCPTGDGRNFFLQGNLYYIAKDGTNYRGIIGSPTDGASTPKAIWNFYPPFGDYWLAAILHDCCFRSNLEQNVGGAWIRVQLGEQKNDDLFNEAMESLGVSKFDRLTIYNAVKQFGNAAFVEDLAKPIEITHA